MSQQQIKYTHKKTEAKEYYITFTFVFNRICTQLE